MMPGARLIVPPRYTGFRTERQQPGLESRKCDRRHQGVTPTTRPAETGVVVNDKS